MTVFQQLRQSAMLGGYAHEASEAGADPDDLASHRAECISLASAAVAALERRRVAGTLLDGKCSAAEVAWPADQIQHDNPRWSAAVASSLGALVGYEEFLHGGKIALHLVAFTDMFAEECSPPQLFAFVQHALRAAELMQQPRRHGDMALNIEADFTDALRDIVAVGWAMASTKGWWRCWRLRCSGWSAAACWRRAAPMRASSGMSQIGVRSTQWCRAA